MASSERSEIALKVELRCTFVAPCVSLAPWFPEGSLRGRVPPSLVGPFNDGVTEWGTSMLYCLTRASPSSDRRIEYGKAGGKSPLTASVGMGPYLLAYSEKHLGEYL